MTITHSTGPVTGERTAHADPARPTPAGGVPTEPRHQRPDSVGPDSRPRALDVAPMWRRLAARAIDVVTVTTWVFAFAIAHIFLHLPLWSRSVAPEPWGTWFLTIITFTICYAAYEIVFIAKLGATPGKDLMGLGVVDATTGARPTYGQAARRWLLPGMVQPLPGTWIAGVLTLTWGATAWFDGERRSVHDRLAGTRVVSKEPPATDEEREARRKQFMPRFIDPFAVYRSARRGDISLLRRHPADD